MPTKDQALAKTSHHLTYIETDLEAWTQDCYRCSCGAEFQANGDVLAAFEHGEDVGFDIGFQYGYEAGQQA